MLQFAAPIGLLALGALLAPIVIHLVRRPRRVVKVGSLRPLRAAHRQIRSLRWEGLLLLVLRCALLAALALALAGIRWRPSTIAPARWLLVVPGTTFEPVAQAEWDRLRGEGFETHVLATSFPRTAKLESALDATIDVWSLLRELDLTLPKNSHAVVFGPTTSNQFVGHRPTLSNINVRWHPTSEVPAVPMPALNPRVALIAAVDRAEDARYVRAALTAIGATIVEDGSAGWIVQLGSVSLPDPWHQQVMRGARLITDAPDNAVPMNVTRRVDVGSRRLRINRRVTLDVGAPFWRDSAGDALASEARLGAGNHWRFALRFHPDWSDWPLDTAFPTWWREQLNPSSNPPISLAPEQAAPAFARNDLSTTMALAGYGVIDLRAWSWLLAAALFATERLLSWRAQRRKVDA